MSGQMDPLFKLGHRPHRVNRKLYGRPYVALWRADSRFQRPGIYLSIMNRTFRIWAFR